MSVSRACFIARVAALLSLSGPASLQALSCERVANSSSVFAGAITSLYVRDSLLYSSFNFSRDHRSCRAAQIVARRFQAHSSTVEKLTVELRVPLELEAGLLDSGVQGLLGRKPNFRVSWRRSNTTVARFLSQ